MWSAEQCSVLPPLIVQGTLCARVEEAYHSPFGGCRWGMGREELGEVEVVCAPSPFYAAPESPQGSSHLLQTCGHLAASCLRCARVGVVHGISSFVAEGGNDNRNVISYTLLGCGTHWRAWCEGGRGGR